MLQALPPSLDPPMVWVPLLPPCGIGCGGGGVVNSPSSNVVMAVVVGGGSYIDW